MKKNNVRPRIEVTSVHQLLTSVKQCALLLAVSTRTVMRMIERGFLPSILIGRSRRIRYSDILSLAENGTDVETLWRVKENLAAK